ncbi:MAG: hypothetical protein OXU20_35460 [Myxococcales bacterium]|nr:hypothetical protein [Myxococcales bacterium]MDD9966107.1 hypothetical protein [Myxococcales bacterium]
MRLNVMLGVLVTATLALRIRAGIPTRVLALALGIATLLLCAQPWGRVEGLLAWLIHPLLCLYVALMTGRWIRCSFRLLAHLIPAGLSMLLALDPGLRMLPAIPYLLAASARVALYARSVTHLGGCPQALDRVRFLIVLVVTSAVATLAARWDPSLPLRALLYCVWAATLLCPQLLRQPGSAPRITWMPWRSRR